MSVIPLLRMVPDQAVSFDDVLLEPAYAAFDPGAVLMDTQITRHIGLKMPAVFLFLDSALDIKALSQVAEEGSIGIVPHSMSLNKQLKKIIDIKRMTTKIIREPITVTPETSVAEIRDLQSRYDISGIPVIDDKTRALVGLVTRHLIENPALDTATPVSAVMVTEKILTAPPTTDIDALRHMMTAEKAKRVILVDDNRRVVGLITEKDMQRQDAFPLATKDPQGRLRVAASIGTSREDHDRVGALMDAGVDILLVEALHGHSKAVTDMVTYIRRQRASDVNVIAGNIATAEAAMALIDAGVDGVKVGVGGDTNAALFETAGVGVPQFTALMNVSGICRNHHIPVLSDGGIRHTADFSKAIAAGASCVLLPLVSGINMHMYNDTLRQTLYATGCETIKDLQTRSRFVRI